MDSRLTLELLAILALIAANGFFSLAEFSIIASRKSRLIQEAEAKKRGALKAEKLRAEPERFLATIQVGITLVATMVGVFSGATIVEKLSSLITLLPISGIEGVARPISMALVVLAITVLSVILGELVPKYLALSYPEKYARNIAGPITIFVAATSIFSRVLSGTAAAIVRMLGIRRDPEREAVDEEEINQMIVEGREKGVFDEFEKEFVHAVFEFADSTVRRAMTPRTDVVGIDVDMSPSEIRELILENGYSRYPIFEETIDNVVGEIYTKDLLSDGRISDGVVLSGIQRKPFFVPDSMPLPRLLKEFQKGDSHLAIVLDEFGGTAGVITLEDVLEELVGEIQDEYDAEAAPLVRHSEHVAYADSAVWPGEVNELLGSHLPEDNVDTLAGLFIDSVGHFPAKRETLTIADVKLTVLATDKNRILRFRVEKTPEEQK